MYRLLIWGMGAGYNQYFNLIQSHVLAHHIEITGIVSYERTRVSTQDGFVVYNKECLGEIEYDYCLLTDLREDVELQEAVRLGVPRHKLIPARVLAIPNFDWDRYLSLKEEGISIISRLCWAGFGYHYLALPFQSPTINMHFSDGDFLRFVEQLDEYLDQPISFERTAFDQFLGCFYPVGRLGDLILHFNHYASFEDALAAWERRKQRMVAHKLIISATSLEENALRFTKLPFKNKLIFVPKGVQVEHEAVFCLDYAGPSFGAHSCYTANGRLSMIDILALCTGQDFRRSS